MSSTREKTGWMLPSGALHARILRRPAQADRQDQLFSPCGCSGTMQYTHQDCLTAWIKERRCATCELCHKEYSEPFKSTLEEYLRQCPAAPSPSYRSYEDRQSDLLQAPARTSIGSWRTFWCHVCILGILMGAVIYLTCFSPVMDSGAGWTSITWRLLTVLIPVYIVGRIAIALFMRWKADHAMTLAAAAAQARAAQRQEQQEERQQQQQLEQRLGRPGEASGAQLHELQSVVVEVPPAGDGQQLRVGAGPGPGAGDAGAQPHVYLDLEMAPSRQQQQQQQQQLQQ